MTYGHDDVVVTRNGKRQRVLYPQGVGYLRVKCLSDRSHKAYKIRIADIVSHEPRIRSDLGPESCS